MSLTLDQQTIVIDEAIVRGIPSAFALGIVDKESAGRAFYKVNGQELPAIRYEGHYLYKFLKPFPKVRDAAVKAGFAASKAGVVKNPGNMASRYTFLARVVEFLRSNGVDTDLAYQSISIGIGQVMGSHYKLLGYSTASQMLQTATANFTGQVEQFLEFIYVHKNGLKHAQDYNYKAFGLFYNGKNAPASYWEELEDFVMSYRTGETPPNNTAWLNRIKALGFDSVMAFQSSRGIKVDGLLGPITKENVENAEKERAVATKPAVSSGQVLAGTAAATVATAAAASPDLIASVVPVIDPVVKAITTLAPLGLPFVIAGAVIVVGVVVFLWFKNRK